MKQKIILLLLSFIFAFTMTACERKSQVSEQSDVNSAYLDQEDMVEGNFDESEEEKIEEPLQDETESENESGAVSKQATTEFVPWAEAELQDHVMDWGDENLEARVRVKTGITDREIMLSDVWEITELTLDSTENFII